MPTGIGTALAIGGGLGLLGAAAGAIPKKSNSANTSGINQNAVTTGGAEENFFGAQKPKFDATQQADYDRWANIANDPSAGKENQSYALKKLNDLNANPNGGFTTDGGQGAQYFKNLQGMVGAGPGQQDVADAYGATKSFADLLKDYTQSGGMPNQNDINQSNQITSNLFAGRQTSLNQSFIDQNTQAQRLSAQLGRPVNDPVLQAKLRTGFIRQQDQLSAEQQGSAQQLALALPQQRLGFSQQRMNVLSQLGGQAMSNQSYLLGLGNQLGSQERQYRLDTSERYNNGSQSSGGGLGGAISGGIGGLGGGLAAGAMLANIGSNPFSGVGSTGGSGGYGGGGFSFNMPSYSQIPSVPASNPFARNYSLGGP